MALSSTCSDASLFVLVVFKKKKKIFLNSVLRPFQDYNRSYETGQEKTPGLSASRTWLVSHVASAGLEPTPGTAVR